MGVKFFEGQLPQLIKNIGRLADELKRLNDRNELMMDTHDYVNNVISGRCDICGVHKDEGFHTKGEPLPEDSLCKALRTIRDARDHHANHGEYPEGTVDPDYQCFDDWAADVAAKALS